MNMKRPNTTENQTAARDNLKRIAAERRISLASLSKDLLGKNKAYLAQYTNNGSPTSLDYEHRILLARELQVDERAFNPDTAQEWAKTELAPMKSPEILALEREGIRLMEQPIWSDIDLGSAFPVEMKKGELPLFGTVAAGPDRVLVNGIPEGWVGRPDVLRASPDAYAMRVTGESMVPKFQPGDIIIVAPAKRHIPGSFVVVCLETDCGAVGLIKKFDRIENGILYLTQFAPLPGGKTHLEFKFSDVLQMHKVVSTVEGR